MDRWMEGGTDVQINIQLGGQTDRQMTDGCMDGHMVMWSSGNTAGTRKTLQAYEAIPAGRVGARSTELAPMPSGGVGGAGGVLSQGESGPWLTLHALLPSAVM